MQGTCGRRATAHRSQRPGVASALGYGAAPWLGRTERSCAQGWVGEAARYVGRGERRAGLRGRGWEACAGECAGAAWAGEQAREAGRAWGRRNCAGLAGERKEVELSLFYFLLLIIFLLFLFIFIHKKELQIKWIHTKTIR